MSSNTTTSDVNSSTTNSDTKPDTTTSSSSKCSCCTDCGDKTNTRYLYGKINGISVFTGFLEKDGKIIWIGLDEKKNRVIDFTNENDVIFYKSQIQQYDP
jgi:hypothetical protein